MKPLDAQENLTAGSAGSGILDAVSHSRHSQTLQNLNPQRLIFVLLQKLEAREQEILELRYGLGTGESETLEKIGHKFELTRERVRQIEKEAIKKLRKAALPQELTETVDLIRELLEENEFVVSEEKILNTLLPSRTKVAEQGILFILDLVPDLKLLRDSSKYNTSWYLEGFDREKFDQLVESAAAIFADEKKVLKIDSLKQRLEAKAGGASKVPAAEILESLFEVSKKIGKNLYGSWGLAKWPEINPKDVGDKAYLVLQHLGKPKHYEEITELINKQKFDQKTAHKETVHNELIKDKRFVLVGRGIYALKEWGYKKGTVAEIISRIIQEAGKPLPKKDIIEKVMEQRMVKKNTIVVGLSNKTLFKKLADGKYVLAETNPNKNQTNNAGSIS